MQRLGDNIMRHPAYARRSSLTDRPPSARIGIQVACAKLDPAALTSDLRQAFLEFLRQPPVMDLLRELTEIDDDADWVPSDENLPITLCGRSGGAQTHRAAADDPERRCLGLHGLPPGA